MVPSPLALWALARVSIFVCNVFSLTTNSAYLYLWSERFVRPYCEHKFFPLFGSLCWSSTWRQLFFFDLDRPVIDLCCKVAHSALYTAEGLSSFGYDLPNACFCGHAMESLQHLFFDCPLASGVWDWVQSLLFSVLPLCPTLLSRRVLVFPQMSFVVFLVFSFMSSMCVSLSSGLFTTLFVLGTSGR